MSKSCVIFDIDGTLADLSHRVHFVTGFSKDWPSFMAGISLDKPFEQTRWLNQLIADNSEKPILLCSGRSEDERLATVEWLKKHGVFYDRLYMRKSKDTRADYIIKLELLADIRADGYEPFLVVDDRPQVVEAWREAGLFVLQCDPNGCDTKHDIHQFHSNITHPLQIMVGPSGAGKSSLIESSAKLETQCVISSDVLRDLITGDFKDQTQNMRVFHTMHKLAKTRLDLGLPVILDATHIKRADRIAAVKLVPNSIPVQYVVVDRPLEQKLKDGGWRLDVKMMNGKNLVQQHDEIFKSNLKDILKGDDMKNVDVLDLRGKF